MFRILSKGIRPIPVISLIRVQTIPRWGLQRVPALWLMPAQYEWKARAEGNALSQLAVGGLQFAVQVIMLYERSSAHCRGRAASFEKSN